ncbi:MAG: DNA-binding transcriptional regulator [Rhodoferax sp.]|nr:DNA-binding transcriptional regulator [Rhodoferax sp.]
MASYPPVRSVERVIELLQCLNRQPVSTLDELHRATGLPRPSLVRLLQTLIGKGLVRHAPQYGAYYVTSGVLALSCGYHSEPRIIEAAASVVDAITAAVKWPVALAVFDGDAVIVRYSTISQSPLSLLHSSLNMRLSLVSRALGRAYLAFCPPDECQMIVQSLRQSTHAEDQPVHDAAALHAMLEQTRAQGYALRSKDVRPVSNTLAVPVFENGHVMASIGLTWFSSAMDTDAAVSTYLPRMQQAARDIESRLNAMGVGASPAASRVAVKGLRRKSRAGLRKRAAGSPDDTADT